MEENPSIYSVGHSSRSLGELIGILRRYGVTLVIDVRRYPGSRRHPWFSRSSLAETLPANGISYEWWGTTLGGFRRLGRDAQDDGTATCLGNGGLRAYALYLRQNSEAWRAVKRLADLARQEPARAAILCRERLPWRCHRWIISDALTLLGVEVTHIIELGRAMKHPRRSCAALDENGRIRYD